MTQVRQAPSGPVIVTPSFENVVSERATLGGLVCVEQTTLNVVANSITPTGIMHQLHSDAPFGNDSLVNIDGSLMPQSCLLWVTADSGTSLTIKPWLGNIRAPDGCPFLISAAEDSALFFRLPADNWWLMNSPNTVVRRISQSSSVALVSGVAAIEASIGLLRAESGVTDDLDTLTPTDFVTTSCEAFLWAYTGHTITIKHGTGNIETTSGADFVLSGYRMAHLFQPAYGHWIVLNG